MQRSACRSTPASMVVALAIAAMGLNLLVGYTGLVSFGHGAWFGIGAYAAGLIQRNWFSDDIFAAAAAVDGRSSPSSRPVVGFLILRRRGVYFSLLTLALCGADLHHRVPLDRGDRRRGRPRRPEARQHRAVQPRQCADLLHRCVALIGARRAVSAAARGALAVRPRADGDPREPVARHLPGLSGRALQARRLRDLGRGDRASPARCSGSRTTWSRPKRCRCRSPASCWRWW